VGPVKLCPHGHGWISGGVRGRTSRAEVPSPGAVRQDLLMLIWSGGSNLRRLRGHSNYDFGGGGGAGRVGAGAIHGAAQ